MRIDSILTDKESYCFVQIVERSDIVKQTKYWIFLTVKIAPIPIKSAHRDNPSGTQSELKVHGI